MAQKGSIVAIVLVIVAIAIAGVGGYFAKDVIKQIAEADRKTGGMQNLDEKEIFSSSTPTPTPKTISTYQNPNPNYSLEYKSDWSVSSSNSRDGYTIPVFKSPDYFLSEPEEGYPYVKTGAQIIINSEKTNTTDIEDEFDLKPIYKEAGQNKTNVKIAGNPAIQFDFGYEGVISVTTIFIKDGVFYTIDMRYSMDEGKEKYFGVYKDLLNSLKFD